MDKNIKAYCFAKRVILTSYSFIFIVALLILWIDPWLHFREPREWFDYGLGEETNVYYGPGMVTNLDYNILITGTSVSKALSCSKTQELFGMKAIRVSQSGASYKEIDRVIRKAFDSDNSIKMVIRPIDSDGMLRDKDQLRYEESKYIEYLFNDYSLDDGDYLWNLLSIIRLIKQGEQTVVDLTYGKVHGSFDDFLFGEGDFEWNRAPKVVNMQSFTTEDYNRLVGTIDQNFLTTIKDHPQTGFLLYFVPYSIANMDKWYRDGSLLRRIQAQELTAEMLLRYENVELFSFWNVPGLAEDYSKWYNQSHYDTQTGSDILKWMRDGQYQITKENLDEYCDWVSDYYLNYNYDKAYMEYMDKYE